MSTEFINQTFIQSIWNIIVLNYSVRFALFNLLFKGLYQKLNIDLFTKEADIQNVNRIYKLNIYSIDLKHDTLDLTHSLLAFQRIAQNVVHMSKFWFVYKEGWHIKYQEDS